MGSSTLHRLYSKDQIAARVREMAQAISQDYQGREPLLVGSLKGAFVFLADLIRHMTLPVQVDFVRVASYGDATESQGRINLTKDLEMPVEGRDLLVVDDIVDSGWTLKYLIDHFLKRGARSVKCCVLLDKRHRREVQFPIDYVGFVMDEGFVVGYGLDWAEAFRHLPDIFVVEMERQGAPDNREDPDSPDETKREGS